MKRTAGILLFIIVTSTLITGQKVEFGIQYTPLQLSSLSFDKNYVIFDDYSSYKMDVSGFSLTVPSLSSSGLFIRFPLGKLALQTGVGFQNNAYYYSVKSNYSGAKVVFFYSSIDIPVSIVYTFRSDAKLKFRILAGANSKFFKIRRSYYSVFARTFDVMNNEEYTSDTEKRKFMINKVNPLMIYSRVGAGISYYNFTLDICTDKNITDMNLKKDLYNANFKDSKMIMVVLGFRLAGNALKSSTEQYKITKE